MNGSGRGDGATGRRGEFAIALMVAVLLAAVRCTSRDPGPAALDTKTELCSSCRMPASDARLAAQIMAPGEEPKFFDDIGCLRDHLLASPAARGSTIFLADHRTGAFIRAGQALITRCPAVETPMGSHLLAHADAASRDADPSAKGGVPVPLREILGPAGLPGGNP